MCQPYMRVLVALSDYFSFFCRAVERHFQSLSGPRNVSIKLKYACSVLVSVCVWHTSLSQEK